MSTITRGAARAGRIIREVILTVLALGGVVCIVLAILAFTGGYSLIMFKTGLMSPTIPAGSVALVQEVPASDLAVGDVVTVDRPGALPITHRITSIDEGPTDAERVVTMRGDANATDDPLPYTVADVRIVRGSVPHLANVIVWFGNPWVLGGITSGAAALVTWAFCPKEPRPAASPPQSESEPRTRRERRAAGLVAVGLILGAGATSWAPARAHTADDLLTMQSDPGTNETYVLDPDEPLYWHIDMNAEAAPDNGDLTIDLSAVDTAKLTLDAEERLCAEAWTNEKCGSGERLLLAEGALALDGSWTDLVRKPTPSTAHLRVALTAVTDSSADSSSSASVTIRATAGQSVVDDTINDDDDLAATGGQSWLFLAAPAAILAGLGIALLIAAKRKRKR